MITDEEHVQIGGERAGIGPFTWGQRAVWRTVRDLAPWDHHLNHSRVLSVPRAGTRVSVADALSALTAVVARHEALRSRLAGSPDEPGQELSRVGRLPVGVVTAAAPDAPAVAEALVEELAGAGFDYRVEWPFRPGLVVVDGRVTHIVLVFSALAADSRGAELVLRDLRMLLRGRHPVRAPGQPLDLAAEQWSDAGRRTSDRALDHWVDGYRRISPLSLRSVEQPVSGEPFRRVRLRSAALDAGARAVAARLRTTSATVLLAATTALLATLTGQQRCGMRPAVDNRFYDGYGDVVSAVRQQGLVMVELVGDTFDDLVAQVQRNSMPAYRHARYDPAVVCAAVATVQRERGGDVQALGCFNDGRRHRDDLIAPARPSEIRALLPESTVAWSEPLPRLHRGFRVRLDDGPGAGALELTADVRRIGTDDMEWYVRAVEALVVASTAGPVPLPELGALAPGVIAR